VKSPAIPGNDAGPGNDAEPETGPPSSTDAPITTLPATGSGMQEQSSSQVLGTGFVLGGAAALLAAKKLRHRTGDDSTV